jgi:glycosyltransferase involved in cell wall biosynthesis
MLPLHKIIFMQTIIIIPCYNEAERLPVNSFIEFVETNSDILFLFVNDGSKDNTLEVLKNLASKHPSLQYLDLEKNGGKAEAVRRGMLYATKKYDCDFIGFLDADLAIPLDEIQIFLHVMHRFDFNIITALRLVHLGAKMQRKFFRHIFSRIFTTTTSVVLKFPVYDTQYGFKMYEKQIVEPLFISRWLFDIEILACYIKESDVKTLKQKFTNARCFAAVSSLKINFF